MTRSCELFVLETKSAVISPDGVCRRASNYCSAAVEMLVTFFSAVPRRSKRLSW